MLCHTYSSPAVLQDSFSNNRILEHVYQDGFANRWWPRAGSSGLRPHEYGCSLTNGRFANYTEA